MSNDDDDDDDDDVFDVTHSDTIIIHSLAGVGAPCWT